MKRVRVDCHLHTVASGDSVLTLEELADRARQACLDAVFITDHNVTHAATTAIQRDLGVRVIVGEEIRTPDGDVIGLFLTERIPYVLPLAEVIGRIRDQGALVYVPHPFDAARSSLGP
ncbi:MAG TPA: PHP domain-containing protein, partial [Trebonia sp.]|nr:PHP domain-containing protein [Trebonia sp.]